MRILSRDRPPIDRSTIDAAFVHPEEDHLRYISANTRFIEDVPHTGLGSELMTGWIDSGPAILPLSRITIGFLEDIGYVVNYDLADIFV